VLLVFTFLGIPILYPVSAILWFWHKVFGTMLGSDNGFAWALSVVFLVFSVRALLLKPAISQLRAARTMQKFAPQIQKLREKYKNDRQRMAQEVEKLQSEHGFNPLRGCLPTLVQIPVFLCLYQVLRSFHPGASGNYVFDKQGVDSFVNASIFGAKLGNWISQSSHELLLFGTDRVHMIAVGVPLMIAASVATFFTMRMSMRQQTEASMASPQSAMISKFMMYIAPAGMLFSGFFFPMPIAVLLYFLASNIWTLGQQHLLTNKIDREQHREVAREIAAKKEVPPQPKNPPATQLPTSRKSHRRHR
jgi:YidC/Oxa1 family membrane protein insertase